ncbi:hypothetical protein AGMMS50268_35060 [Spirochaetia bacterium]|nr:hypothetical protein AGMMS50268_35060 [Spirochaetia bacterium]
MALAGFSPSAPRVPVEKPSINRLLWEFVGYSNYQWSYNGPDVAGTVGTVVSYTFTSAGKDNGKYTMLLRRSV